MRPYGTGKRKRGDRTFSEDDINRPSPHRPANLEMARQGQPHSPTYARSGQENRGRGYRRAARGGRSTYDWQRQNNTNPSDPQPAAAKTTTQANIDPPSAPTTTQPVLEVQMSSSPSTEAAPIIRPYHYLHLTDHTRSHWEDEGRQVILNELMCARASEDEIKIMNVVQELIHAAALTELSARGAGQLLRDFLQDGDDEQMEATLLQTIVLDALSITFEDNQSLPREPLIEFIQATGISEDVLRQEFDQDLLQKLGMIRSTFGRMGIRKQTNVLYRQANFNLMREESEGFAKLMTELFTTSGNEPPTGRVVEETVGRVKAMIGAFDLDVGRSLDVVLDVFGAVLVKQFRFFVKFLRASPWWPQIYDETADMSLLGGLPLWARPGVREWKLSEHEHKEILEATRMRDIEFWPKAREKGLRAYQQVGKVLASAQDLERARELVDDDFTQQWIAETGTLPGSTNRDAAQLLGFKLRFYSSSTARDPLDVLPDHLIYLSALLIKIGFISLNDLYSHIWRSDDEMEDLRQLKLKEKAERERAARPGAGAKNALLLAGALADDTVPVPTRLREPVTRSGTPAKEIETSEKPAAKDTSVEPLDQKVLLLKSLLAIGALPEALFILGRFPWILDLYPELPEYIHRILHHSLSQVYQDLRPLHARETLKQECPVYETDIPGAPKGSIKLSDAPQKRVLRWAQLDKNDSNDGTDYRFYWDEWHDNIPVCQNVEDVFTLCQTILPLVGVKIGQDPLLILKFARIGKHSLKEDTSVQNQDRWLGLIKRVLLPSLSLTKPNAGVVNEVFELISHYSTNERYVMYLEWSTGRVSRNPDVKAAFDQAKAETKDVLKRISKTNVKPMARSLAKIAYANPHVVISTALQQIEAYDSIAEVFVEGSRYFTDLGYDVLSWALISSMGRDGRSRTQEGGIFASRWLSALSQFAGKIFKRYSMMKPGPVLQYVSEQLEKGNSTDLKMLEQIVVAMAGIATDTSFNDAQLQAMGGGPLLQSQTILQLLDRRGEAKTSSRRLVKALQDHGLTAKFLLSMAQQRQACVFDADEAPLKAIGNTFDEISRVMNQYLDLLRSNLTSDEFQKTIPDVAQLLVDFEIPADVAFWIYRPILAKQMAEFESEHGASNSVNGGRETTTDVDMKGTDSSEEDGEAVELEDMVTSVATPSEAEIEEAAFGDDNHAATATATATAKWDPVLKSVMDKIHNSLPQEIVETIGVGFYVTFWQLSLYDISVPSKSYEDEMSRQRKKITAVTADRSNISAAGAKTRENVVKQHQQLIDDLLAENKQHLKSYTESRARLQREKDQWFANKQRQSAEINTGLMEFCFLPRIMSSPQDAFFCFKFVKFLHNNSTANFRTLGFYDALLRPDRLASLIFMCTSKESDNLGRFLCELFRDLGRWHKDKSVYEREAFGSKKQLPGFAMKVENGKPQLLLDFENFRRILFKWHSNLYSALIKCLASPEYMHIRNAISILRSVSAVYPAVNFHGSALQKAVSKLRESDREDLKVSSQALLGALHRREREWIIPQAFRQGQGLDKTGDPKTEGLRANDPSEIPPSEGTAAAEEGEAEEISVSETSVKAHAAENVATETKPRPSPGPAVSESSKERTLSSSANEPPPITARSVGDAAHSARRSVRPSESNRSLDLPRKLSPSRLQPPLSLPTRPEIDSRNEHREGSRSSTRQPVDIPRSDSRMSQGRYSQHDRGQEASYDLSHRLMRPHERSTPSDRGDRSSRRDHELRQGHDERARPERDTRLEREARAEYPRVNERDARSFDRDSGRVSHEPGDRKRPERADLIDDRRPAASSLSARNTSVQPVVASINPERAALISGAEPRSGISIRGQAQERPRISRASPPPRREEDRRHTRPDRDDRSDRGDRNERLERVERNERLERSERLDRRQDPPSRQPPSATTITTTTTPLHSRSGGSSTYPRDSRSYNQPPIDLQHGRLEPESPNRQSPRHERSAPEPDVPLGPRPRPSNLSRRGVPPPPVVNGNPPVPISTSSQPSVSERTPPTGPAKHSRTGSAFDSAPASSAPDTAGVHPDRMNLVTAQEASRPPPRPPQINTQASPPSGPRNTSSGPLPGPSPNTRGPPTGPQMDGVGRGRRHPLAAVNNTLAQASGPSGRGRGSSRPGGPFPPMQSPVQSSRPDFNSTDPSNPNGVPVHPRPTSARRESMRDMHSEDENRTRIRSDTKDGGRSDDMRRSNRRDDEPRDRGYRSGPPEDLPPRKHHREDGHPYQNGPPRGGARISSESKRPRRGA